MVNSYFSTCKMFAELRATLMEKENQLSKTRQELEELQEYKVGIPSILGDTVL